MPKRTLRDWSDSPAFDGISADSERLFVRILMKADDYGRYYADPRLVRAGCFPLMSNIRVHDVHRWLAELAHRALVLIYDVSGKEFLVVNKFRHRVDKSVPKFPSPSGLDIRWCPEFNSTAEMKSVPGLIIPGVSRNFPELPGTSRNFPELPGTSRNFPEKDTKQEKKNPPLTRGVVNLTPQEKENYIPPYPQGNENNLAAEVTTGIAGCQRPPVEPIRQAQCFHDVSQDSGIDNDCVESGDCGLDSEDSDSRSQGIPGDSTPDARSGLLRGIPTQVVDPDGHDDVDRQECRFVGQQPDMDGSGLVAQDNHESGCRRPPATKRGISQEKIALFDAFWAEYPKKVAKTSAMKAFMKINPDAALLEKIISAVRRQRNTPGWKKNNGEFIPHPGTYLNNSRWDDVVVPGTSGIQYQAGDYKPAHTAVI